MIDRNLTAGQCVHVGMKRMTEVASTALGLEWSSIVEERPVVLSAIHSLLFETIRVSLWL